MSRLGPTEPADLARACANCGELPGDSDWKRRRTCPRCGQKACPFCFHHIHAIEILKANAEKKP